MSGSSKWNRGIKSARQWKVTVYVHAEWIKTLNKKIKKIDKDIFPKSVKVINHIFQPYLLCCQ